MRRPLRRPALRPEGGRQPGELGRLQRFLFSFMGPPQLGDPAEPPPAAPPPSPPCPKCRQSYDLHEIVRDARLTYTRCPPPAEQRRT